ncbi:Type 1 glutamine amidotransferase-like domain-containing protein [Agromyces sp. Marseille-P2726]|uniref:Type 1 glutamine amidotransferase-like domain-containing protein n=1 Tax=Agromyces sp. Marseille-P2726 TaxID=2709132 RepID=UPI00156EBAF5|nr:Type 1 glutamine amidotransferase-like domain-containing protein [Agromyces sp. Marseille-P2726]
MSVHLVGGGWADEPDGAVYTAFIAEAATRAAASARPIPRIAVIAVRDGDELEHAARLVAAALPGGEFEAHVTAVPLTGPVPATAFADVDGILVGGGLTPIYRDLLEPHFGELRRQVAAGVPYLGFSAGAAIAADTALVGGWRIGEVPVAPEESSEELDEVTVAAGIGLIDVAVDVHVAQWGTLTRLVAAVEAGLVEGGLGIDEHTVLIVGDGGFTVTGRGSVWRVLPSEQGVLVGTIGA